MCKNIKNNAIYLSRMQKTYLDKSWFMSIIPDEIDTIVDFGCADNSFNEYLGQNFPEYDYIGIDNNPEFIKMVRDKGQTCFSNLQELTDNFYINPDSTLLVMNSVLHEIYSYANVDKFYEDLKSFNPKYIAFRDMYARDCGYYGSRTQQELETIAKVNMKAHYNDFVKKWGQIDNGYTAVHFLLKYFYNENWNREVNENYIPYHYRELHERFRRAGYNVTFERFYGLMFLKDKWHKDFRCDENPHLKTFIDKITTHLKLFLVRGFDK